MLLQDYLEVNSSDCDYSEHVGVSLFSRNASPVECREFQIEARKGEVSEILTVWAFDIDDARDTAARALWARRMLSEGWIFGSPWEVMEDEF